jgi:hypothetical protein
LPCGRSQWSKLKERFHHFVQILGDSMIWNLKL